MAKKKAVEVEFLGSYPIGKISKDKVYVVTTLRFGFKYGNRKRSPDGKFHSFYKRTSPNQKKYFTIVSSRTWGWFNSLADAKKSIRENWADMYEHEYSHAVIEEIYEGILHGATIPKEWWFKWEGTWNEGGYKPWDKPKEYDRVIGFMNRMRGVRCH